MDPERNGHQEAGVGKSSVHDGGHGSHQNMDMGGGGKPNQDVGRALCPNANLKWAGFRPLAGAIEEISGVMVNLDDNTERVGRRLMTDRARKTPLPRWCPRGLTKMQ
jgi:hypothetical protein